MQQPTCYQRQNQASGSDLWFGQTIIEGSTVTSQLTAVKLPFSTKQLSQIIHTIWTFKCGQATKLPAELLTNVEDWGPQAYLQTIETVA